MKDERELLTREIIAEKLVWNAKRSMVGALMMLVLGAVLFGMLFAMSAVAPPSESWIGGILEAVTAGLYFAACVFFFVRGMVFHGKAKRGAFTVEEDVLSSVEEDRFSFRRLRFLRTLTDLFDFDYVFRFESGRIFYRTRSEAQRGRIGALADLSMAGDRFYLVTYEGAPQKVVLLYSARLHRLGAGTAAR